MMKVNRILIDVIFSGKCNENVKQIAKGLIFDLLNQTAKNI